MKDSIDRARVRRQPRLGSVVGLERGVDGARREDARVHRVVDPLQRSDVDVPRRVAHDADAAPVPALGQRQVPAFWNRLGAPLHHLAAIEDAPEERVMFHALQQPMHIEPGVCIVETDDEPQRHQVVGERIRERAPEPVLHERPPHGVDDPVERTRHLPQLLDPQRVDLRIGGAYALPVEPGLGEGAPSPLGEHGHAGGEVHRRHVRSAARLPVAIEAARRRPHADHAVAVHEEAVGRESRQDHHAGLFGALTQPPHHLADRRDVVAMISHGRRRRDSNMTSLREEVHRLAFDTSP